MNVTLPSLSPVEAPCPHRVHSVTPLYFSADQFHKTQTIRTADLFAKALKNEGVTCVFGVPGEETLDLLDALHKEGIRFITTRDEEGAAFMAATQGRLTGKPGVCLATLGPGAAKFANPAAYATLGGMPLIMITGQKPFHNNQQSQFQLIDIVRMMEPLTKSSRRITEGAKVPQIIREAFQTASSERPGAVHLELPEDIAEEPVAANTPLFPITQRKQTVADTDAIHKAAKKIAHAKRPLLLIGAGAKRTDCGRALQNFTEKTGVPFFSTQLGKGAIDETHPQYLGTAALSTGDDLHQVIDQSDLVISVGNELEEKPPFLMKHGNGPEVIHIGQMALKSDQVYFPQTEVLGNIADTLNRISTQLAPTTSTSWKVRLLALLRREPKTNFVGKPEYEQSFFDQSIAKMKRSLNADADSPSFPMIPQRVVADVQKAMPEDGIVTLDNGLYKIWFARNYYSRHPDSLLLDNALATMGAGLASAMEASRLYPNRKVLSVCGDGGFMMNSQELETAVREKLNLTVLILRDNAYGMIRWKQQHHHLPEYALHFGNPDFVQLAQSYGAEGHRVTQTDDLLPTLRQCLNAPGVHVVEAPIDYTPDPVSLTSALKLV